MARREAGGAAMRAAQPAPGLSGIEEGAHD